jgi:hypothetical protein
MKKFVVIKDPETHSYLSLGGWLKNKEYSTLFKLSDAKSLIIDKKVEFEETEVGIYKNVVDIV